MLFIILCLCCLTRTSPNPQPLNRVSLLDKELKWLPLIGLRLDAALPLASPWVGPGGGRRSAHASQISTSATSGFHAKVQDCNRKSRQPCYFKQSVVFS